MKSIFKLAAKPTCAALLIIGLAGCKSTPFAEFDEFTPATHYQNHPIRVSKGTVKLQVDSRRGELSVAQKDKVVRFAQDARAQATPSIIIRRPRNSDGASAVANEITELLLKEGLSEKAIDYVSYNGRGPVEISFKRHFASTNECGIWPEDMTNDVSNTVYENFGCANQHNFAAQVANAHDFVQPRTSTPADATRRTTVFEAYRAGEDTASADSEADDVSISDAAN